MRQEYLSLEKLEVYQLSRELSRVAWRLDEKLDWRIKRMVTNLLSQQIQLEPILLKDMVDFII